MYKKFLYLSAMVPLALALSLNAAADEKAQQLMSGNGCVACHATDSQLVGPSYTAISEHYEESEDNIAFLVDKIRAGGAGSFGQVPMPPHGHVSEEDARVIVEWIFTL
ncbi:c-type cytochrome [Halomonas alkalisoli]|uniref:c-type cytochrome n=1 Tax=Halomonas alkalisoli TaxID=2907158 RepID=UPI001F41E3A4|nr:c-type cytochrome [Halomonas alkalisoli]MCE9682497.1 c-type cytochrome [Halomonas alkalisoli]